MAGFRSSSLVVLILVLCQTWSPLVAAPALTVAKRSADKGKFEGKKHLQDSGGHNIDNNFERGR